MSHETEVLILTCRWTVDGGPINVTEVPEFLLRTVEWNDTGSGGSGMATETGNIINLQTKAQTN